MADLDHIGHKALYRIIKGRFRIKVNGLFLLFKEPTSDLIEESYAIYDDAYIKAYGENSLTESELQSFLIEEDIWSPLHQKDYDQLIKDLDNLKVKAYESFYNPQKLLGTKREIKLKLKNIEKMLGQKHSMDHLLCGAVAENARLRWLVSRCFSVNIDSQQLLETYQNNLLDSTYIRYLSKQDIWRAMWNAASKCTSLFDRAAIDLTRDQLTLISFSRMYDNVYESPECPDDKIIEDDDCLDGWFIVQKRKSESDKKRQSTESAIKNSKIKNAQEVFVMAGSKEEAENIYDINDTFSRNIIHQRHQTIQGAGQVKHADLPDFKQEIEIQKTQLLKQQMNKGRK